VYDEDLTAVDEGIRRLKIEYDIFFIGNRKKPPDDLRFRIERIFKRLSEATDMTLAQRFRYNTLIARFCVYRDLWRRTQQNRECGNERFSESLPNPQTSGQVTDRPAEVNIAIADPAAESDKIRHLYDELLRMRGENTKESPSLTYLQFSNYIVTQTRNIQERCQCANVTFRIALEEKSIKFTAKADTNDLR
jgi:hypothetical protein